MTLANQSAARSAPGLLGDVPSHPPQRHQRARRMDLDRTLRVAPARRPPSPCPLIGTTGRDQQGRGRGGDCLWRAPMAVASACASGPKPKSSTEAIPARGQRLLEHLRPSGPPVPAFAIRDRCQE